MGYDPADYCKFCSTHLDNPCHSSNCPAYDGPPRASEGFEELCEKVDALCEAVGYLVTNLPVSEPIPVSIWARRKVLLKRLKMPQ